MFKEAVLKRIFTLALIGSGMMTAQHALAAPQPNTFDSGSHWVVTGYNDNSTTHVELANQGICFLPYATSGTQIRGRWYSDTYPGWQGNYSQEGDQVFLHGDYDKGTGHDSLTFEIVTQTLGTGHWVEWKEDNAYGTTVGFVNAKWERSGKCGLQSAATAAQPRALKTGGVATDPLQPNQVEIDQAK